MSKRLSKELKDAVVTDYLSGLTIREIKKKHKTYELYTILNERAIEYKQNNKLQKEKHDKVIKLYLKGEKLQDIEKITGCKNIKNILKRNNIKRKRDPKKYITHKKEERNKKLIEDYLNGSFSVSELSIKYNITKTNIYRILKVYNIKSIKNKTHHWVINQKVKTTPNMKCKFYILEDYHGYTKIGITTKNKVKDRYRKNIKIFYEIDNNLEYCYHMELRLKKMLKSYIPSDIDKSIDGWSECYTLSPSEVMMQINNIKINIDN